MSTLTIVSYEQDGHCEHCGRPLKHCIKLDDGRIVGATCFAKVLTKPLKHYKKSYRLGPAEIIRYAQCAARYSEAGLAKLGLSTKNLTFEAADD